MDNKRTNLKKLRVVCADCGSDVQLLGSEGTMGGGFGVSVSLRCPKCDKTWNLLRKEDDHSAEFND